ncbi:hypothetical protein OPT61_g92 [Boeremia exigua]|uniref:Uncharacterized protein n=1 Tax=Boeremia exigua TaxID=749465 RepID=A0ACC2IVE1_9PLEO|nr:hypothetical protein OPT61_g92 [Boeremia exigua]
MATLTATAYEALAPKSNVQHVENIATDDQKLRDIETVALVVSEPKADFELQPIILDEIRDDEVLVEMKYSGICHTDIVLQQGLLPMVEFPAVFGHEGAGFVRGIGSRVKNKTLQIGDAVLLSFNTCGACKPCKNQHPAFCHTHAAVNHNAVRLTDRSTPARTKNGQSVRSQYFGHSSFSKMSVVNEKCVVKCAYPDQMGIYAPIGCGFQTGAGTVLNVLKPGRDDSLVVFGLGSVGLTALMAAKHMSVGQIIAIDIVQEKLQMAKELGATDVVNSKEQSDVVRAIKLASKSGAGATFAIDCTGVLRVIEDMVACLAPQGTAAVVGVPPPDAKISIDPLMFLLDNKRLIGVIEGDSNPEKFIPELIELHQKGAFPIEKLCRTYPVEMLKDAIHDLHTGSVRPSRLLPTSKDIEDLLEAARTAAKSHYPHQDFQYIAEAFDRLFSNSLQWIRDGEDPSQILINTLQDERAILDRHNRLQAKGLFRERDTDSISEDPLNFPLRYLCRNVRLPVDLLAPIYRGNGSPGRNEAAQQAHSKSGVAKSRSEMPSVPNAAQSSAGHPDKNPTFGFGKIRDAPSAEHDFPDGNFTLAEMAAFLPQSFKCWDVIDRIVWNGAGAEDLQRMINRYRTMPYGEIEINSTYLMMRGQMRKRTEAEHNYKHWASWVVGDQKDVQQPDDFDPASVSVTGFRRPFIFKNRPNAAANPILFGNLALGVSEWPNGPDALDLTRCVKWCADHPEEGYYYPTDYHRVLRRLGGPVAPEARHTDAAVLSRLRFDTGRTQSRHRTMPRRSEGNAGSSGDDGVTDSKKRKSGTNATRERTPSSHNTLRKTAPRHVVDSETDTDDEAYQGPKRMKKNKEAPRRSGRTRRAVRYDEEALVLEEDEVVDAEYEHGGGRNHGLEDADRGEHDGSGDMDLD